jgi:hypothetical protein
LLLITYHIGLSQHLVPFLLASTLRLLVGSNGGGSTPQPFKPAAQEHQKMPQVAQRETAPTDGPGWLQETGFPQRAIFFCFLLPLIHDFLC